MGIKKTSELEKFLANSKLPRYYQKIRVSLVSHKDIFCDLQSKLNE